ncbi:MAG: DMP19 family protein [Silicimonas sp.]|nr:DMP19 family protein [Silicimonas sp.]
MFSAVSKLFKPKSLAAPVPFGGDLPILIPQSAMMRAEEDPYALVQALITYVNMLMGQGQFTRDELPSTAIRAYHTDYYTAQVNNGGHSQFIRNAGATLDVAVEDVLAELTDIGAEAYLKIARQMADWIVRNPKEASEQTGFTGGRAEALDVLDSAFYALNRETTELYKLVAAGLKAAPTLQVVEDEAWSVEMETLCASNPNAPFRTRARAIASHEFRLSDPMQLSISLAVGKITPDAVLVQLGNGAYYDVDGTQRMCFSVQTSGGRRWAVVLDGELALHDCIEHDNPPMPTALSQINMEHINAFKAPEVGAELVRVTRAEAEAIAALSKALLAPAAIDLLLSGLPQPAQLDALTITDSRMEGRKKAMLVMAVVNQGSELRALRLFKDHAECLEIPSKTVLNKVSRAAISDHAAKYNPRFL